jgi:hypothetical protein
MQARPLELHLHEPTPFKREVHLPHMLLTGSMVIPQGLEAGNIFVVISGNHRDIALVGSALILQQLEPRHHAATSRTCEAGPRCYYES